MNQQQFNAEEFEAEVQEFSATLRPVVCDPYQMIIEPESGTLEVFVCENPDEWTDEEFDHAQRLFQHNLSRLKHFLSQRDLSSEYKMDVEDCELIFLEMADLDLYDTTTDERIVAALAELSRTLETLRCLKRQLNPCVDNPNWKEDGF